MSGALSKSELSLFIIESVLALRYEQPTLPLTLNSPYSL